MLRFRHGEVIGVDIGSGAVKIVQLHKSNGDWVVSAAAIADIPKTPESTGKKPVEANTVRALRDCLRSTRAQTRRAVCGVSGPEVAVRSFDFHALSPEEIPGAVMLEAAQVCPFDIDECAVSYQLTSDAAGSVSGILVAAMNSLIETKKRCAKSASLKAVLMDVDGLALLNCFCEIEKPDYFRTAAILNVGGSCATLAVMGGESSPFVRDMPYPGGEIAEEIAAAGEFSTATVGETPPAAENQNRPRLELSQTFQKAFKQLVGDISETLRYCTTRKKSISVEKIYVCGGFATVEGFVELLDRRLPAPVVLWDPLARLPCRAPRKRADILPERSPAMAVAMGLAMRTI